MSCWRIVSTSGKRRQSFSFEVTTPRGAKLEIYLWFDTMNIGTDAQIKNEADRSRKRSAEDREIDEWAKKLMTRPVPQIPTLGQTGQNQTEIASNSGFDIDSAIGRFTWHAIGDKFLPCLFRSGSLYCCIRMVETSVMGHLLNVLPQEIYDSAKLCSHFATAAEAKLLSYINSWHCDGFYGNEPFTETDLLVTVKEVEEFYSYLTFAYKVLASGGQNKDSNFSRCGFVRVNNESLIPYAILRNESNGEKGVPLFYFEGQTDILKEKAKPLSGWDLSYLKICCKVQGVRKELIADDSLNIVKLSDLKSYFPKRTVFTEQCWPPSKGKSLLPKQNLNGLLNSTSVQTSLQKTTGQPSRNPLQAPNEKITTCLSTTTRSTTLVRGPGGGLINGASSISVSAGATTRSSARPDANGSPSNTALVNAIPEFNKTTCNLQSIKAAGPPTDSLRLPHIDEHPESALPGAYKISSISVEKKVVHVINFKPFTTDILMVLLPHLLSIIGPNISVYTGAVDLLKRYNVNVYLPNSSQLRIMNEFGFSIKRSWEMPLVFHKELMPKLDNLRVVFQQIGIARAVENHASSNNRISYPSNVQLR